MLIFYKDEQKRKESSAAAPMSRRLVLRQPRLSQGGYSQESGFGSIGGSEEVFRNDLLGTWITGLQCLVLLGLRRWDMEPDCSLCAVLHQAQHEELAYLCLSEPIAHHRVMRLILLPFRNSALDWLHAITSHSPSPSYQIENQACFLSEYDLPAGAVNKLTFAEPGTYPLDHVETFKGNLDDNFRIGVKRQGRAFGLNIPHTQARHLWEQSQCTAPMLSLGYRLTTSNNGCSHNAEPGPRQLRLHLNKLPKESHDTDFSRIKPWYLDGLCFPVPLLVHPSIVIRDPEMHSLFNSSLKNVTGKVKIDKQWSPIIPMESSQTSSTLTAALSSLQNKSEKRFHHFMAQILPSILKISRACVFMGEKSFLLVSECFHFYRWYICIGIYCPFLLLALAHPLPFTSPSKVDCPRSSSELSKPEPNLNRT
ncbi:hypothetical protein DFP72DRAFT_860326 [Ephemerocybe angulata]|uniref:UTP25 NTP hydrolase-like domain-containing protein n=1 Tax=Ephemerocybe angulata TaxID=980116 RepID=A0A8H6HAH3_9AGAR|nr:hypothetical protein DFP72DRAFT_860326 [Tulosesus angulatus]